MTITDQEYENRWKIKDQIFSLTDEELENYVGFVYVIQGLAEEIKGKKYIGQKLLWSKKLSYKTNPKTKIRKKIRTKVPSDWKNYYGSSEELKLDIAKYGKENFSREIIYLCRSKGDMNYLELREQIINDALIDKNYYNSFVGGKIHRKHISANVELHRRPLNG